MVEIKKCVQIIDFSGNIIYRFRDIDEVRQYNHTYWKLKGDFLFILEASNYAIANDFLFYYEDQKIEDNMDLIYAILKDTGISIEATDKHNINRYGNQYTMDILKQVLDMKETKTIHTQVDWESQVFGNYEKPELNIEAVLPTNQGMPANPYNCKPSILKDLMMEKRKDALGGQDGGNYDDKGNSDHYQDMFIEFIYNIELMFGTVIAALVCESNVIKYDSRRKEGVPFEKDRTKAEWYRGMGKHFRNKAENFKQGIVLIDGNKFVNLSGPVKDLIQCDPEIFNKNPYISLKEIHKKHGNK